MMRHADAVAARPAHAALRRGRTTNHQDDADPGTAPRARGRGRPVDAGRAGQRAAADHAGGAGGRWTTAGLDPRRAPSARARHRRRRRHLGRLLRRRERGVGDRPRLVAGAAPADGRRHGCRPAGDPQPGAVDRAHDLGALHRAVAPGASGHPPGPRHDRPRSGHPALLPRRGDLHRLRRCADRAHRVALDLSHVAGHAAQVRQLPAARDHRRHGPPCRPAHEPVPDAPRTGCARRRPRRLGPGGSGGGSQ